MNKKKKILISDDDPDAREIARTILELSGFRVIEASNGVETENAFQGERPDLLLLDLLIPGGGVRILKKLKENNAENNVPVLAYTAMSGKNEQENLIRQGFSGVVPKPCRPSDIVEIVRKFLKE